MIKDLDQERYNMDFNLEKPKQLVIIGGGSSIQDGLSKNLWEKLKSHFTIGLNFSFKFFEATFQSFVDSSFYNANSKELEKVPLIIGQGKNLNVKLNNTFTIRCNAQKYNRDLKDGIYKNNLTGIYALSLAIYLLDEGEIFLLGYDSGAISWKFDNKNRPISHFYQGQVEHRGIGKINYYNSKDRDEKDYGVYRNETKIKIYNVSPKSNIHVFPKINYDEFFNKLDTNQYDQNELRSWIKEKLKGKFDVK